MYSFYLGDTLLPVTPSKLTTKIKNNNKTINLINQYEINILKAPGLTDIKFEAMFPNVKYPFARYPDGFKIAKNYLNLLEGLKNSKRPFQFIVSRNTPTGYNFDHTNMTVTLESYEIKEAAADGIDVVVSIELKQYRGYGTRTAYISSVSNGIANVVTSQNRNSKEPAGSYTVSSGDTLWNIAKESYGSGSNWQGIYQANQGAIESAAKSNGMASSSNGWYIFPGTELVIP